jgi:hypothetical protein
MNSEMPALGGIAAMLRWLENLAALLSGPLLTVCMGVALTDLLSGGRLLASVPWLLYLWACAQAVGIDAQLVGAWDRCRENIRRRRWLAVAGLVLLGTALMYVGFLSVDAFGMAQAFGLSESEALARLGLDGVTWQTQRAVLAVFLVALSGFTRERGSPKTVEDERKALERELTLEPLRQRVRREKALGAVSLAKTVFTGKAEEPPAEQETEPETTDATSEPVRQRGGNPLSVEDKIRRALTRNPALSGAELARIVGCSKSQALRIRRKLVDE